jgi:DNA-binding GntR family transcriptional regulator
MISVLFNVVDGGSCQRKNMTREKHRDDIQKAIGSGRISTGTRLNQDQTLQRSGDTR